MFADRSKIVKTLEPLKLGAKIGDVQIKLDDVVLDVAAAVLEHMVDAHMSTATVPPGSQTQVDSQKATKQLPK